MLGSDSSLTVLVLPRSAPYTCQHCPITRPRTRRLTTRPSHHRIHPPLPSFVSSNVPFPPFKSRPVKRRLTLGAMTGVGSTSCRNPHVRNGAEETPILAIPSFSCARHNWSSAVRYKISANPSAFGCNNLCPAVCARGALHGSYLGMGVRFVLYS